MTQINNIKSLEEDTNTHDQHRDCFHDHRGAPFRFKDQIDKIEKTALPVQQDGLVNQHGLTAIPLPFPEVDLELEEFQRPLEPSTPIHENEILDPQKLLQFSVANDLYLPKEDLDLGYDFGKEFARYQCDVQLKRQCNLSNEWLPFCFVDVEKDEGLGLTSTSSRWQILALRELEREGIEDIDEDFELSWALNGGFTTLSQYSQQLIKEDLGIQRFSDWGPEPISAPLSPASSSESLDDAFIPNNEATIIDLTSEPSSPKNPAIDDLQRGYEYGCLDSEPAAPTPSLPSSPPPSNALKLAMKNTCSTVSLKVDVPLVLSTSPSSENGKFNVDLEGLSMHEAENNGFALSGTDSFFDEALMELIQDQCYSALQMAEEEKLDSTGSLLRMRVPSLSFNIDPAEWKQHLSTPEAHLTWLRTKFQESFQLAATGSLSSLESTLKWTPVPLGSGRVVLDENFDKLGGVSQSYLILEQPQLCSTSFISRGSSPSIFQITEDIEIEDEPISMEADHSVPSQETLMIAPGTQVPKQGRQLESLLTSGLSSAMLPRKNQTAVLKSTSLLPESTDLNATSNLLSSFIELRNPKRAKLTGQAVRNSSKITRGPHPYPQIGTFSPTPSGNEPLEQLEKAPVPETTLPQERCRFIVSLGLNRVVLAHIEKLWPKVELVDRDLTQYNTVTWSPGSAQRREVISPLSYEADILLSPSAGIILTTLLKVKQRPLPGSNQISPLRSRIQQVSQKYETLFILVSEANPTGEYVGTPSASDLAAYADFEKFTRQLQAGITPEFISGRERTLAKWTVSLMCRFARQNTSFEHLLQSGDSPWDLSFRRAGMNAFAAQVLSGVLLSEYGNLGFVQFLAMDIRQRVSKYTQMMGGDRVFRRACKSLDQERMRG